MRLFCDCSVNFYKRVYDYESCGSILYPSSSDKWFYIVSRMNLSCSGEIGEVPLFKPGYFSIPGIHFVNIRSYYIWYFYRRALNLIISTTTKNQFNQIHTSNSRDSSGSPLIHLKLIRSHSWLHFVDSSSQFILISVWIICFIRQSLWIFEDVW